MSSKILLIGDTHLSSIIAQALKQEYSVTIVTPHFSSTKHQHHNVRYIECQFVRQDLSSVFEAIRPTCIISTTSGGSFDLQTMIIDLATQSGVAQFIPCEFSHDTLHTVVQQRLPPHRERARVIEYLRSVKQLSWCGIATGIDLEYALRSGNIGLDIKWQSATIPGTGDELFAAHSSHWPGLVVSAVLKHWHEVNNRYIYAPGILTSVNTILKAMQSFDQHDWQIGHIEINDVLLEAERRFERGYPDSGMVLMQRSVLFDAVSACTAAFEDSNSISKLQLIPEDLQHILEPLFSICTGDVGSMCCS